MADGQLDLPPLTALATGMESNLNCFLDDFPAGAPPELRDVLFETRQLFGRQPLPRLLRWVT